MNFEELFNALIHHCMCHQLSYIGIVIHQHAILFIIILYLKFQNVKSSKSLITVYV